MVTGMATIAATVFILHSIILSPVMPGAAEVLATKVVLNEFVAFLELAVHPPEALSPRSRLVLVYAVCGFANFGSLGIMIGGLAAMVPERRGEIVGLGTKSIAAGLLATCVTGCVVGILTPAA